MEVEGRGERGIGERLRERKGESKRLRRREGETSRKEGKKSKGVLKGEGGGSVDGLRSPNPKKLFF